MQRARVLALALAAPFVLATAVASAAPPKKPGKKKKTPKTEQVAESAPAPAPAPEPPKAEPPPPKAMPVTQAADTKPVEAKPEPDADRVVWGESGERRKKKRVYEDDPAHFSIAPLLGYSSTYLGFGIGARGGYTFENKLYVGGTFMFHFGYSYGYSGLYGFGSASVGGGNVFYPAAEIGYDFRAGPVTIRPMFGGGPIFYTSSGSNVLGVSTSGGTAATGGVYPGVMAAWNIPRSDFFLGGDTRVVIPFQGYGVAFGFYATAGLKF